MADPIAREHVDGGVAIGTLQRADLRDAQARQWHQVLTHWHKMPGWDRRRRNTIPETCA